MNLFKFDVNMIVDYYISKNIKKLYKKLVISDYKKLFIGNIGEHDE